MDGWMMAQQAIISAPKLEYCGMHLKKIGPFCVTDQQTDRQTDGQNHR